jgi:D-glycero-alpha-D-manno-heptose-7-phosphate kinase
MIISRTPFRISFLGGGTDYPAWYRQHGGAVIATTIDKYCYLTCRHKPPFLEYRYRIVYTQSENCHSIDEISHPAVREVLKYLNVTRGLEIHHDADLPARSGMGSSSAFTVGLLHVLHALSGQMVSKQQLALEGIHVEQERIHETVGSQDQVMAAYGGLNHVRFLPDGEISVHPITLAPERRTLLNAHLLLFYTGIGRTASQIADSYVGNLEARSRQLRLLQSLVEEGLSILGGNADLAGFGRLLNEAWLAKRDLSQKVSNARVDEIYESALSAGAVGGKLLGAGGGGFLMFFAPPDRHESIKQKLQGLLHVPFAFDSSGSQIIFFNPETDYSNEERLRVDRPIQPFSTIQ